MTRVYRLLRRVRGALGLGILWAGTCAVAFMLIGVLSLLTPWLPWSVGDVVVEPYSTSSWIQFMMIIATVVSSMCAATAVITWRIAKPRPEPVELESHEAMLALVRELNAQR